MKPEKDKTTHDSTCTDLQLQEMEDRDYVGLRKMRGGGGAKAGGFAERDSKVKNKQTKTAGRRHGWRKTKTSGGSEWKSEGGEKVRHRDMTEKHLQTSES